MIVRTAVSPGALLACALWAAAAIACGGEYASDDGSDAAGLDGSAAVPFDLVVGWHQPTYGDDAELLPLATGMEIPRVWGLQGSPMIVLGFSGAAEAIDEIYASCTFVRADDGTDLSAPKYRDNLRLLEREGGRLQHDHFFMILVDEAVDPGGSTTARLSCDFCGATAELVLDLVTLGDGS